MTARKVLSHPTALTAALAIAAMTALHAAAQSSDPPPAPRAAPAQDPDLFETIRISKPDGSVVTLRVPKRPGIRRTATTHRPARATEADDQTAAAGDDASPARYHGAHAFRISHPTRGLIELEPTVPEGRLLAAASAAGRVSRAAAVAGDDPTQWRTGRGWRPGGEKDDGGDYIADDPVEIQPVIAGTEFIADWPDPTPIGDPDDPGYEADVIARWDVVPHQTIEGDFEVGILAFHMNGVERVEVWLEGGPPVTLREMVPNPRTGVREFVTRIQGDDVNLQEGELIELRAKAYPLGSGTPRLLEPLFLYVNPDGRYTGERIHVAASGDDAQGDGSLAKPFATIRRALNRCNEDLDRFEGARIILTEPGRYDIDQPSSPVRNTHWITVESASSVSRDQAIIAAGSGTDLVRPNTQRLRFHKVSLDFSDMYQMYKEDPHQQWYDDCKWFYGEGWTYTPPASIAPVRNVGYGGLFVTDSLAIDGIYAFINCNLVRNSHAQKISGDVFQNSIMVVQSSASLVDGTVMTHHSDLLQYFGTFENLIVYNVNAAFVKHAQNFFLDHNNTSFTNCAFVNVAVQNAESDPPFSQLNSAHDHVLFQHISNPGQRFVMRDDFVGSGKFVAKNVIFRNSIVERLQAADYFGPIPKGVSIDHCHFNYNEPRGNNPTVGTIAILASEGGQFDYAGPGEARIRKSAAPIRGYSDDDQPDRGAQPWAAPR